MFGKERAALDGRRLSPALTQYIADEVKRWTAFVEEKGLKK